MDIQLEPDQYLTLAKDGEDVYREKMSRFLAFAHEVKDEKEAKDFINSIADKYHDARHVCWAYMVGSERKTFLSSDNGEPSGTAGKPILGQINSFGITDTAIAVVRYFGGIKLGTSGLIVAYRSAARLAIENAGTTIKYVEKTVVVKFSYMAMNDVMKAVKKYPDAKFIDQQFDNVCLLKLSLRAMAAQNLMKALSDVDGVEKLEEV